MFLSSLFFFVATSPPAKKTNGLCRWVNWITINSLSNLSDLSSPPSSPSEHLVPSHLPNTRTKPCQGIEITTYRETIKKKARQTNFSPLSPSQSSIHFAQSTPYKSTYSPKLRFQSCSQKKRDPSPPLLLLLACPPQPHPRRAITISLITPSEKHRAVLADFTRNIGSNERISYISFH